MFGRLPIALAQLKSVNNSKKFKMKSDNYCILYMKNESNKSIYQFSEKLNIKTPNNKNIGLVNLSIYYSWKNIKFAYNNNKFKISAPTWNDKFELPDGSYSISDFQDSFEFIIKKHGTLTENLPVQIYPNKTKERSAFKIKTGYKLELLSPETMNVLGKAKNDVDKDKDGEDVPKIEPVEVVLVHCNLVNNSYQKASKVLFTFVSNKQFGQLITISPHLLTMIKLLAQNSNLLNYVLLIRITDLLK